MDHLLTLKLFASPLNSPPKKRFLKITSSTLF